MLYYYKDRSSRSMYLAEMICGRSHPRVLVAGIMPMMRFDEVSLRTKAGSMVKREVQLSEYLSILASLPKVMARPVAC